MAMTRPARGYLKKQGGLSHPGLTSKQHDDAGHQAVTEYPVQLCDPGTGMAGQPGIDAANRDRLADRHR
jgi:hypothetical protein